MSYTYDDAAGYLSAVTRCLANVRSSARTLRDGELNDATENMDTLDSEIEDLISAMPCEEGVMEFANGNHDECYSIDDVALSNDGLHDRYDLQHCGLVRQDDIGELLEELASNDTGSFILRKALLVLADELSSDSHRGQLKDAADYRQEVRDNADADTTISAA